MTARILALVVLLGTPGWAAEDVTTVTPDNFARAESDLRFSEVVDAGGFGRFAHRRAVPAIDAREFVGANRDTLQSSAVFDLDAAPVTVTLPDAGPRFMSMQVIDEDHYSVAVSYGAGARVLTREQVGTRYVMVRVRTRVERTDAKDVDQAHALQDAISVSQRGTGRFQVPEWDRASRTKVREALLSLAETLPDTRRTFGSRAEVDPVRHLVGTAASWGGAPERDALFVAFTPKENDGETIHRLVVDVPVDGFWSISVYDAEGYFRANRYGAYVLNDVTARKGEDGAVTVQFGGCDGKIPNCLPIAKRWNYTVRLYRPRAEILSGAWTFPEAAPVP